MSKNKTTKIVQAESGNPALRGFAEPVPPEEIKSKKIVKIIKEMKDALSKEKEGVAIAAPQIGISMQIFIISKKVFQLINSEKTDNGKFEDLVFINPEIIKLSKEKEVMEEGCLSVRDYYGKIKRATKATIRAYDENGKIFERGGSHLLAQIFQHEIDHLNGILFTDTAKDIHKIVTKKK